MKFIISFVVAIALLSFVLPSEAGCRGCRGNSCRTRVVTKVVKPRATCRCGDSCACTAKNNCGCKSVAPAKVFSRGGCANGNCRTR